MSIEFLIYFDHYISYKDRENKCVKTVYAETQE